MDRPHRLRRLQPAGHDPRLVTGEIVQASIPNHGEGLEFHEHGKPVTVHAPAEARVLSASTSS